MQLVPDESELDWSRLPKTGAIGVTAAASTPESSVQGVIDALGARYRLRVLDVGGAEESTAFKRVAIG